MGNPFARSHEKQCTLSLSAGHLAARFNVRSGTGGLIIGCKQRVLIDTAVAGSFDWKRLKITLAVAPVFDRR